MAQQASSLKILAIGSPLSALSTTVDKITAINAKHGPFDACVLVGDVFAEGSDASEVSGVKFPVPTYFTLGNNELPAGVQARISETGGEVVDNLVFLGKSSVLTTAQGLKIGCVGGSYDAALYESGQDTGPYSPIISKPSVDAFLANQLFHPSSEPSLLSARESALALPTAFQGVDLLLLSSPPPSLNLLSTSVTSLPFQLAESAAPLAEVVKKSRPRYVFWGEGEGFWEREPWGWTSEDGKEERWTRAVKLGALGGKEPSGGKKARWFYAFSLPPQTSTTPLPTRPANATPNPFTIARGNGDGAAGGRKREALDDQTDLFREQDGKKARADNDAPPDTYVCKICQVPGHWIRDCPNKMSRDSSKPPDGYKCNVCGSSEHFIRECPERPQMRQQRQGGRQKKELEPAECWFCLSNPKVTKHLITNIGDEVYVTLPKGQLIPTTEAHTAQGGSKPLVPGGGHVLIIPIAHHPTLLSIPQEDAGGILKEIEAYKASLAKLYEAHGAVPVAWEVGRTGGRGGHAHVQIVPVPKELAGKVAPSFKIAGEKQGLDWEEDAEAALKNAGPGANYFRVDSPDGTRLVHLLKGNFDLQFGRMVVGSLLGLQHRIDWKECAQSEAEEKQDALAFKKAFAAYQP